MPSNRPGSGDFAGLTSSQKRRRQTLEAIGARKAAKSSNKIDGKEAPHANQETSIVWLLLRMKVKVNGGLDVCLHHLLILGQFRKVHEYIFFGYKFDLRYILT
jgi:hypothetical protein